MNFYVPQILFIPDTINCKKFLSFPEKDLLSKSFSWNRFCPRLSGKFKSFTSVSLYMSDFNTVKMHIKELSTIDHNVFEFSWVALYTNYIRYHHHFQ